MKDYNTLNLSFIEVHNALKSAGIENNDFMLTLLDESLKDVNPYCEDLGPDIKMKIIKECSQNYWYFLREIVQYIVDDIVVHFPLTKDATLIHWLLDNDYNVLTHTKFKYDISYRLLWEFLFTSGGSISLLDKSLGDAKDNLFLIKKIRNSLPDYLRLYELYNSDGKKIISKDNEETLENPVTYSRIKTLPVAKIKKNAVSIGRGLTSPRIWYNDFENINFADIVYNSCIPAFYVTNANAKKNGNPTGIIITTKFDDGGNKYVCDFIRTMRINAADFNIFKLDWSKGNIDIYLKEFSINNFIYVRG